MFKYKNSKDQVYYLNVKKVTGKNGYTHDLYFFSRDKRPTACALPDNKVVVETSNGMPVLKGKK